jgi:citrate synthase
MKAVGGRQSIFCPAADVARARHTPVFAVSRISGWTAHILEQYANNRLIRPRADYVGTAYPQRVVPLDQR